MRVDRFFFGQPPFSFLIHQLIRDEDFLSDANKLIELDTEQFSKFENALTNSELFLDKLTLKQLILDTLGVGYEFLTEIIDRIGDVIHESENYQPKEAMELLEVEILENADKIDRFEDRKVLTDRIKSLVLNPKSIIRQHKAEKLVQATLGKMDSLNIICDIRPIFDNTKQSIEGAIVISLLKLEYTDSENNSKVLEIRISENQIREFSEKFNIALTKTESIKKYIVNNNTILPITKFK